MRISLEDLKGFSSECEETVQTVLYISSTYTDQLDECIVEVQDLLDKQDLSVEKLNYYIATIPIIIYSINNNLQSIGIKSDVSKMERKRVYNETYLNIATGTVANKTSIAQSSCEDEQFIEDIFNRVYKQCESKIDIAIMLHGSLKKILQWRISELEVTRTNIMGNN